MYGTGPVNLDGTLEDFLMEFSWAGRSVLQWPNLVTVGLAISKPENRGSFSDQYLANIGAGPLVPNAQWETDKTLRQTVLQALESAGLAIVATSIEPVGFFKTWSDPPSYCCSLRIVGWAGTLPASENSDGAVWQYFDLKQEIPREDDPWGLLVWYQVHRQCCIDMVP